MQGMLAKIIFVIVVVPLMCGCAATNPCTDKYDKPCFNVTTTKAPEEDGDSVVWSTVWVVVCFVLFFLVGGGGHICFCVIKRCMKAKGICLACKKCKIRKSSDGRNEEGDDQSIRLSSAHVVDLETELEITRDIPDTATHNPRNIQETTMPSDTHVDMTGAFSNDGINDSNYHHSCDINSSGSSSTRSDMAPPAYCGRDFPNAEEHLPDIANTTDVPSLVIYQRDVSPGHPNICHPSLPLDVAPPPAYDDVVASPPIFVTPPPYIDANNSDMNDGTTNIQIDTLPSYESVVQDMDSFV